MKKLNDKIILIFGLLLVALVASAAKIGDDNVRIGTKTGADIELQMGEGRLKWDSATSKMQFSNDSGASVKAIGSGGGAGSGVNLLENADFESGAPPANWTASGGTFIAETVAPGFDLQSGSWDSSATSETLDSDFFAVPLGLESRSCNATIQYKYATGSAGDYKLQVVGNTAGLIAEKDLTVTTDWRKDALQFTCPSSDSVKVRITSTLDGGIILVDNASIGKSDFVDVSQTELTAQIFYPSVASCNTTVNNASFTDFAADPDCGSPTVLKSSQSVDSSDDDRLDLRMTDLRVGSYSIEIKFHSAHQSAIAHTKGFRIRETTTATVISGECGENNIAGTNGNATKLFTCMGFFENLTQGARTFRLQGFDNAAGVISHDNSAQGFETHWKLVKYPSSSAEAITLETVGEHWDVNIGGANVDLGSANEAAYREALNGSLDMVINPGSKSAEIPCQSTNPSTGLTCSVGLESVGIVIDIATAGRYRACFAFAHFMTPAASSSIATVFQIVETPNNAQTILAEGGSRVQSSITGADASEAATSPNRLCGEFTFNTVGQHTLRLMYEQSIGGTVTSNRIDADRNTSLGQRDIHVTVDKLDQQMPTPVFTDLNNTLDALANDKLEITDATNVTPPKVVAATISCSGSASLTSNPFGHTGVAAGTGAGVCSYTFATAYTAGPVCVAQQAGSSGNRNCTIASTTTTVVNLRTKDPSTGAADTQNCAFVCAGIQ